MGKKQKKKNKKKPKPSQQGSVSTRNIWRKTEEDTNFKKNLLYTGESICYELALLTTKMPMPEALSAA